MTHVISFYSGNIPHKLSKKLGTMMPCMTHVISYYNGKSHINSPKKLSTMMPCMTHVIWFYYGKSNIHGPKNDRYHDAVNHSCDNTSLVKCLQTFAQKTVQYHNAVNDTRYLILFWEYPTQTIKKARYHDAVYDTCYFISLWQIPYK